MIILSLAIIADWYIGDPDIIWRRVPHPVVLFGKIIDIFDSHRRVHRDQDLLYGLLLLLFFFFLSLCVWLLVYYLWSPLGILLEFFIIFSCLAQRSLYDHVRSVYDALLSGDLTLARSQVGKIVGRDITTSDESEISQAAIESLSENYPDGILAPLFWYLLLGVFGIVFYKAINTSDSMIGKRTDDYELFGKPSAKLDDYLNYVPSRISILLISSISHFLSGYGSFRQVLDCALRDGDNHPSPNAGYPQAAFASSLGIRLGSPRIYSGISVTFASFNSSARELVGTADIYRSLVLFTYCCQSVMVFFCIFSLGFFIF